MILKKNNFGSMYILFVSLLGKSIRIFLLILLQYVLIGGIGYPSAKNQLVYPYRYRKDNLSNRLI